MSCLVWSGSSQEHLGCTIQIDTPVFWVFGGGWVCRAERDYCPEESRDFLPCSGKTAHSLMSPLCAVNRPSVLKRELESVILVWFSRKDTFFSVFHQCASLLTYNCNTIVLFIKIDPMWPHVNDGNRLQVTSPIQARSELCAFQAISRSAALLFIPVLSCLQKKSQRWGTESCASVHSHDST